ncbi:hypothetical protein [Agromyces larvae]|uniref:Terminase n=1 Tax=Agromyces larvae TaxID=2929802 RepID=A0ABY4C3S9_9MICO|nr:hypothetical protein [Agromyces larvae]UOE45979.1 hypothetical protein MTO99_09620 [Agromyces larvae]
MLDNTVFDAAIAEIQQRSRKALYQRDFAAWLSDVLGERMYEKMAEISDEVLFGKHPRTLVKSANGTGKTHSAARWALWWITAFPKEESLAIITAPTLTQVRLGVYAYLKETYGYVKLKAQADGVPMPWPGWITEQDEWRYATPGGNATLAVARVPGASDAVSTFQGLRKTGGRNFIVLDEAGGVKEPIYTAIDALMTSGDARMGGIGNPDNRGTPFYDRFTDERYRREYQLHTITAYDIPTLTGEIVYPGEPEKERLLLKGLTSARWVYERERMWKTGGEIVYDEQADAERNLTGKPDARFKAKVLGEFPNGDDRAFFAESDVQNAREAEIDAPGAPILLGVDLAAKGNDESVVMVNQGGRCRVFDRTIFYDDGGEQRETTGTWSKEDEVTSARRVHAIAQHTGATEVRVDAGGLGSGVASMLMRLAEFDDKRYVVIRIDGGRASADRSRWFNARAENHDYLRTQLRAGAVDIDYADTALRDQLLMVTFELDDRGAVKITPKKDMRTEMHGSPDRLDALIYAVLDSAPLTGNPLGHLQKGDIVQASPWEMLAMSRLDPTYPL